jgi:hypothetical protein
LSAVQVSEFVLANCRERSGGSASILVVGLRALLRYLHLAGITPTGLVGAVPAAACWPATTLPTPISHPYLTRILWMRVAIVAGVTGRRSAIQTYSQGMLCE